MARLNTLADSDDELPDFSTVLAKIKGSTQTQQSRSSTPIKDAQPSKFNEPPSKIQSASNEVPPVRSNDFDEENSVNIAHFDSLLISFTDRDALAPRNVSARPSSLRSSPRKAGRSLAKREKYVSCSDSSSDLEDALSDHMSDFIVSDAESDESCTVQTPVPPSKHNIQTDNAQHAPEMSLPRRAWTSRNDRAPTWSRKELPNKNQSLGRKHLQGQFLHSGAMQDGHESNFEEPDSILKFSPPRLKPPSRSPPVNRPATPPTSPSRSKLLSPSKRFHIPPSPHRPSIEAFWSQETINDWNDQHSLNKTPKSSRTRRLDPLRVYGEDYHSPCETARRSPSKSPVKRDKQAADRRKVFNEKKYALAASFLEKLDQTIVNGQITALAKSTGGVRLIWSRKLQSTAGRANWKRETTRTKNADGTVSAATYRHHASIELAEKVIDAEDRLINVIAHEYCHLLTFMISNVKDRPHGREFKLWAKKCSAAFAHQGIIVTTKHSYEIAYKYVWACTQCATEYKRHSKSIDPARHSCGKCKEKLVQIKPVPRAEGRGPSEYQKFVKENFTRVKKERPAIGMGEVMAVLGREFREMKEKRNEEVVVVEEKLVEVGQSEKENDQGLNSVVMKLDFLKLGST
ncbi:MAG: hypothetical protein LQ343_001413 [Gyalolechia ehrenbergii]|nr:MAG: hypothetical protein LQ343_001413 [Gyalolechia ehrenbergii]